MVGDPIGCDDLCTFIKCFVTVVSLWVEVFLQKKRNLYLLLLNALIYVSLIPVAT